MTSRPLIGQAAACIVAVGDVAPRPFHGQGAALGTAPGAVTSKPFHGQAAACVVAAAHVAAAHVAAAARDVAACAVAAMQLADASAAAVLQPSWGGFVEPSGVRGLPPDCLHCSSGHAECVPHPAC